MEQHPIPRNITGFQFKLIGDMTLRQFGYLAGSAISAYILFKILPLGFVFNLGIAGIVFFAGFAFAFLPFQDRPLDQWIGAFIKSVYSPTQFIYQKENQPPEILNSITSVISTKNFDNHHQKQFTDSRKMLESYLAKIPKQSADYLDQNERMMLSQTLSLFSQNNPSATSGIIIQTAPPTPVKQTVPTVISESKKKPSVPPPVHASIKTTKSVAESKTTDNQKQVKELSAELQKLRSEINQNAQVKTNDPLLEKRFLDLEQKLTNLLTEREKLTQELAKLQQRHTMINKTVQPKVVSDTPQTPTVRMISQQQATKVGILNQPTSPNLIIGIVNDQNGLSLANVLITVKDMRGTPLRALKTNKLGQFFASTPLSNGTYVLEVEDPQKRYSFDLVELKLTGEIIQPLVIVAKPQQDPIRDKLTKELFQKNFS